MMLRIVAWVKRVFVFLWLLILIFISAAITADNPQIITLYLLGKAYQASAGFLFMLSLGFGVLLGILLLMPRIWVLKRSAGKFKRLLQQTKDVPPSS